MQQAGNTELIMSKDPEVYVFIRAKSEYTQKIRQAAVSSMKIIENSGGRIIGIAESVKLVETEDSVKKSWPTNQYCVLVLLFSNAKKAKLWTVSDPNFRQQDFPPPNGTIEGIILPLQYPHPEDYNTFALIQMRIDPRNVPEFQSEYVDKVAPCLDKHKVYHGVVVTDVVDSIRNTSWIERGDLTVVHQFQDDEHLYKSFFDPSYDDFKKVRRELANSSIVAFTVHPMREQIRR